MHTPCTPAPNTRTLPVTGMAEPYICLHEAVISRVMSRDD